jgi:hypothetical protein
VRSDTPGPGQHGYSGQQSGNAESLQEEVCQGGPQGSREIGRMTIGRGIQGRVARIVARQGNQHRQTSHPQRQCRDFRTAAAHQRAQRRRGEVGRLSGTTGHAIRDLLRMV